MSENPKQREGESGVIARNISTEMKEAYLDYAMSVITARALPDARDGLKPVHRRILFSMHNNGLTAGAKFRKSATVVGDVIGSYHPHGDAAVYDALVKMAQTFSYRYPIILGQGNFGSVDGDAPAAYRYTEAKMSRVAEELLKDIEKETVSWRPNYDGTKQEPSVLPASVPNLLLNGTLGIAVGMATNIPPHNLGEVTDALVHLIENRDATTEELVAFIKGPDFPTGGVIFGAKDILHAYTTGKGGIVIRGEAEIVEEKKGYQIVITSLPYRVNKSDLIMKMAELVHDKKLEGVRDLRDESTKDIRIVVELKNGAQPQKVLNYLYKHTQLEEAFHMNAVALVDGVPETLSLKGLLEEFLRHREEVVTRRTRFDLTRAEDREHILLGLTKALDHIDRIVKTIKASKDAPSAHASLMKEFKFSDKQAAAILEMKLQKLAGLERKKIEDELAEVETFIAHLKDLLAHPKKIWGLIKDELLAVKEKHADPRRTRVVKGGIQSISEEDLIPDEENVLVLTAGGYVKRTNPGEYRRQKRGGVGVIDLNTKEEDFVTMLLTASTHDDLLFFTDRGKVYQIKMYDLPEGKRATKGKAVVNFLSLASGESVTSVLPLRKGVKESAESLFLVTKNGIGKNVAAKHFHDVRRSGLIALTLKTDDRLVAALPVKKGEDVMLVSESGQSIRFKASDVREMGRSAAGVRVMRLRKGDRIVGAAVAKKREAGLPAQAGEELLVVAKNGYGKKTPIKEYKTQKRGGSGVKTARVTAKTGKLIAARIIAAGEEEEIVIISGKGQVIRTGLSEVPSLGRQTQGVRVMKLRAGDHIASLICL